MFMKRNPEKDTSSTIAKALVDKEKSFTALRGILAEYEIDLDKEH